MVGPAGAASRTLSYVLGGAVILLALAVATTPLDARSVLTWVTDLFGPVFIFLYISLVLAAVYAWTRMQNSRHGSPAAALWLETGLQAAAGLVTLALTFTLLGISLGIATLADQELTPATIQEVISALTQKFSLAFMTTVRPPGKSSEPPEEQAITENEAPVVTNVAATVAEGRALLRILEHGKGPSIEIAWPASKCQRQRLHRVLTKCYGLQPGIVDADETAYVWDARTGAIKPLDLDRTSGFVRVVSGAPVAGEVTALAQMRRALGGAPNATPVRTFPRRFDALLLGGLQQITRHTYAAGGSLRASYQLKNGRVQIAEIAVNGTNKPGVIDLSPVATCA